MSYLIFIYLNVQEVLYRDDGYEIMLKRHVSYTILIVNSLNTNEQDFVDIQYDLSVCDENTLKWFLHVNLHNLYI